MTRTKTRIPTADELRDRLRGLDRLLTAKKWERAAIVFAFTAVGGPRNTAHHIPPPPKMNIRNFAGQGYLGLTTPKAVSRYREAWVTAIQNGWAVPVEPGEEVELPDEPFPAWPYGEGTTWEDHAADLLAAPRGRGPNRPLPDRVFGSLDRAATALRQLSEAVADDEPLTDAVRVQLVERLTTLRDEADDALRTLGQEVPVLA